MMKPPDRVKFGIELLPRPKRRDFWADFNDYEAIRQPRMLVSQTDPCRSGHTATLTP
jgi:hypothetical protein